MTYNLNIIEKSNVNYRIMIYNLNMTGKGYNVNLKTLNYALLIINSNETQFAEQIKNLEIKIASFFLNFFFNLF